MLGVWDLPVEPKLQYKDNIYYMAKNAISKNDKGLTYTCGMSDRCNHDRRRYRIHSADARRRSRNISQTQLV